jgi:hypothetical protein
MGRRPYRQIAEEDPGASGIWNLSQAADKTHHSRFVSTFLFPILHLTSCIALTSCMIGILDGYYAVSATSPRCIDGRGFKLRVSDITTLIAFALSVIKILVGAWTGMVMWNCVFILLESQRLNQPRIRRVLSLYLPPLPKGRVAYLVGLLLLLVVPQQLISPLLSGAVDWSAAFEGNTTVAHVKCGDLTATSSLLWYWYANSANDRRCSVRRVAAFASQAWDGTSPDRRHCRHNINSDSIPLNSRLLNATVPCIQIHSITFPDIPPSEIVFKITKDSINVHDDSLSRVDDAPLQYFHSGNAVLFDPDNRGQAKFVSDYPPDFIHTGPMVAVVYIRGPRIDRWNDECSNLEGNIFGLMGSNNIFTPITSGNYFRCYSYAVVNFTAGVATSPTSAFISGRVVEADLLDMDMELRPGPWVQEAIYLMSDVMSMLSVMNVTSLNTWGDPKGYIDKLIRYSYQATWDMLFHSFDPKIIDLDVNVFEPRLRASVSRARVSLWLAISFILTLSVVLLVLFWREDV